MFGWTGMGGVAKVTFGWAGIRGVAGVTFSWTGRGGVVGVVFGWRGRGGVVEATDCTVWLPVAGAGASRKYQARR